MKKAILFYSETGNTKLVCEYIQKKDSNFELIDIKKNKITALKDYDILGFASNIYNLDVPPYFIDYLSDLDQVKSKPAFIVFTYSIMAGKAIKNTEKVLTEKGFVVFDYFDLHMPESFPPYRKKGIINENAPDEKEMTVFNDFLKRINNTTNFNSKKVNIGFWNTIISSPKQKKIKKDFGNLQLYEKLCYACKTCFDLCVYKAISFDSKPEFNMHDCNSCYSCLNNCPQDAIYTSDIGKEEKYSKPDNLLENKFL